MAPFNDLIVGFLTKWDSFLLELPKSILRCSFVQLCGCMIDTKTAPGFTKIEASESLMLCFLFIWHEVKFYVSPIMSTKNGALEIFNVQLIWEQYEWPWIASGYQHLSRKKLLQQVPGKATSPPYDADRCGFNSGFHLWFEFVNIAWWFNAGATDKTML